MYHANEQQLLDLKLYTVWGKSFQIIAENARKDILKHGVSLEQFSILEMLYSKGPQMIQKICDTFSIPSGSITYVVDKLEQKGLVQRQPCPTDRRGSLVSLTEHGEELLDHIFPKHVELITSNFSSVSEEEKRLLIDLLKKIGLGAAQLPKE